MGKKLLFTEQERKMRENSLGNRLGRGLVKAGSSIRDGIDRQVEISREEKRVYNEAYNKARLKEIEKKAGRDARSSNRKGKWEMPF